MQNIKVGDRVRVTYYDDDLGMGTVTDVPSNVFFGYFRVMMDKKPPRYIQEMFLGINDITKVTTKKTLADALSLEPLPRKILGHLERRKSISPMEALTVYGTSRLAAAIHKLREAGYDIVTSLQEDDVGHRYARYSLAA